MQYRAVIGPFTGRNTVSRYLCIMGLIDKLLCRKCRAEEETSGHVLRKCEALVTFRHNYLGSFFLDPRGLRNEPGGNLELYKGQDSLDSEFCLRDTYGLF
jgi:ribosomal protein L40E